MTHASSLPSCEDLLAQARRTLLDEVLPQLQGRPRHAALMVANALGIASRECALLERARTTPPQEADAVLVDALRAGHIDATGQDRHRLHAQLIHAVRERVRIDQPAWLDP